MMSLLEVRGLTVELPTASGWVRPVNDVGWRVRQREDYAGTGVDGLAAAGARVSGEAWLEKELNDLKEIKDAKERKVRGRDGDERKNLAQVELARMARRARRRDRHGVSGAHDFAESGDAHRRAD